MRELRRIPSGIMSSKARGRSFSIGAERREQGKRSSSAAPQFAAGFEVESPLDAARRGVETGGPTGAADGCAGGVGAVVGGADAAAGAADGVGDGGDGAAIGGDGIGAGGVGGTVASLDCGKIRSLTKELSDEIALSAAVRTAATPSKYPETCSPRATKPCKA